MTTKLLSLQAQSMQAIEDEDYVGAESHFYEAYRILLEDCTKSCTASGAFTAGMSYAGRLISFYPTAASGYQLQGRIHEEQLQYESAAKIYAQGVNSIEEPCDALNEAYQNAKTRRDRKFDFVARLPDELIVCIFDFMLDERLFCTNLEDSTHYKAPVMNIENDLCFVGLPFLNDLRMLTSLTVLEVKCSLRLKYLVRMLLTLLPHMTRLRLQTLDRGSPYELGPIDTASIAGPKTTALQELYWMNHWNEDGMDDARFLAAHCPKLSTALIRQDNVSDTSAFALFMFRHVQRLCTLTLGDFGFHSKQCTSSGQAGLQHLAVDARQTSFIAEDAVADLVDASSATLTMLCVTGQTNHQQLRVWGGTRTVRLECLVRLYIGNCPTLQMWPLSTFFSHCIALETIQLACVPLGIDAIEALLHLRRLEAAGFTRCSAGDQVFYQLYAGMAAQKEDCSIKKLGLAYRSYNGGHDNELAQLGNIVSLTHLHVSFQRPVNFQGPANLSERCLQLFTRNAKNKLTKKLQLLDFDLLASALEKNADFLDIFGKPLEQARSKKRLEGFHKDIGHHYGRWVSP
ncbi:hypothetical protein BCR43DRAFT_527198 [Syncephalastrum racemosum]|uniref:F-box domain-containing protein n=1 Tax=Syncephalastrum racemosum TaxID=13706 RepID=A0A1X2H2A6_SYNRA|nr:hypothetical protein BCR43DRAFT_527198 [Syncephalastrum racemosum]